MSQEFEALLTEAFPDHTWPTLTRGVREAVKIADSMRRSTPFLSTLVGGDLRGLLRRAAVMWRIQKHEDRWLAHLNVLPHVLARESGSAKRAANSSAPNPTLLLKFRKEIARSIEQDQEPPEAANDA
jgi:hypothetical protein